ncbi:MAG: D-alanyl-D-alanine carboxypeptidase [Actinobacteria bacterium]|nr:D-alanyl-D-alanine carboxypeptidase [Actinomycetota bacterium]
MGGATEPLSYRRPAPPPRRRRLWPALAIAAVVLVVLAVAALVRAETKTMPYLVVHRVAPRSVKLPGGAFRPAWPSEGAAAVAVEGLGSLGSTGGQNPVPIASVAKVMTAYLTLKQFPLAPGAEGFHVRISKAQVAEERQRVALDQSTIKVRAGETLSERQLLEALMLPSANNIAALLAVHDAGSIGAFVERMNQTAGELGMAATTYTDPSGYEASTVSTAADQMKLARVAMADPTFAQIVAKPSTVLPVVGRVVNYNELVGHDGYVGIKTGSDEAAGGCLLFAKRMTAGGKTFTVLGAIFGQREGELVSAALAGADRLAGSVAAGVEERVAVPAGTTVMRLENADGNTVPVKTARTLREVGWPGMRTSLHLGVGPARRSARQGERLGTLIVRGPSGVARTPVVAAATLGEPSLAWRLQHLP